MTEKNTTENRHSDSIKFSVTIVLAVVIVMACYMSVNLFKSYIIDKINTEYLETYTFSDSAEAYGIALREESIVVSDISYENIIYRLSDGDRSSKGSVIASCNDVMLSYDDNARLKQLESRISQLTESTKATVSLDLPTLDSNIVSGISELLTAMEKRNISDSITYADKLHVYFNEKDIKLSGNEYYISALSGYEAQKNELLLSYNTEETLIVAGKAGYFYTGYDGYEYLSASDYNELTVNSFNELLEKPTQPIPKDYIGKLELSPSWYFCCIADSAKVSNLYVGQKLTLQFEFEHVGIEDITFYVSSVSRSIDGKTALRLRSDTLNSDIFSLRKETATIVLSSYSGYKVSSDSLRVVDGQDGIYVLSAQRVIFKPVKILYSTDSFAIVSSVNAGGTRALASKDAVIVGGKELYDGKIVQQ